MDTTPNYRADPDIKIAVVLCQILDCLEIRGDLFPEGASLDQIKHRIKSWAACYVAARDAGLLDELTTSSRSPSILPPHFGPAAQA
jgi:hypothetical protein